MLDLPCPCCSGKSYVDCCQAFIEGRQLPKKPEQLMRSRYCAYSQANIDYIEATMRGAARRAFDKQEAHSWASGVNWLGLEVKSSHQDGDYGEVEFIATFESSGTPQQIRERSRFDRIDGKWYYTDQVRTAKIGRNDPCPCGSGKKFKKCCINSGTV